ncbi:MAG: cell division ATP-binding protein FtsE [Nitrospirae bacterium]|nr:cell division ATP-binding protein FtsE [Nitrospirota bacterium]
MIEFNNVSKTYDSVKALIDITFKIEKGEMAFIMGPSGAGKSTLLKLLYLSDKADIGSVSIAGFNIATLKETSYAYLRRNIGFVFQDFKLLKNKSVYDNIALTLRIRGVMERDIKEKVYSALKMVNLRHKIDSHPLTLSGGEQQRVTIARALVGEPTVMLADEPTGNLDVGNETSIMNIFKDINAKGTTILVATHNVNLVKGTGKRALYLDNGRLVKQESI